MRKELDEMSSLLKQHNISPPRENMFDDEEQTKEDEICLHASLSPSKAYVIDFGASNHIVASMESFITFPLSGRPRIQMGGESKISDVESVGDIYHHTHSFGQIGLVKPLS